MNPTPRPLSVDIHRNSSQTRRERQPANNKECLSDTLIHNPVVDIKRKTECKGILDEVHSREGFARLIAVGVDDVGYDTCSAELDAEVDQTETDDYWDRPGVLVLRGLTPGEESDRGEDEIRD
jgi:hypothetical protein